MIDSDVSKLLTGKLNRA